MFDMFDSDNAQNYSQDSSSSSSSDSSSSQSSYGSYSSSGKGFVLSVGGSVFIGEKPLTDKINEFCSAINNLGEFKFVIVVGGGKTARAYQESAKDLGANNFELDSLGIASTRLNAKLFTYKIEKAHKKVITNFEEIDEIVNEGRIPIMGGMAEGQTTDAVGALLAEKLGFEFVNLSNVDGIYDKDPNAFEDAMMFKELSFNDMNFLLREKLLVPGQHLFVDPQAASILSRSKVKSFFLNGDHLENFKNCLREQDYKGTVVDDRDDVIDKDEINSSFEKMEEHHEMPLRKRIIKREHKDEEINPHDIDFGK
ncbi:MAG: UMP kinase [Candidatus Diapherotrites archaeon]|jgi:uridylate kinase|uniref:UMP kinase n=1 Tax=Candidatus Iainarchaeum sp. TaxID=3101447 RepID=A0A8T5GDQ3_9ARCH|nr:UMP kinase [Candidatus Diapherotrites archaeon]MBT7240960.1 UMP kinase [Candidatus Diapherotrites archaeon]